MFRDWVSDPLSSRDCAGAFPTSYRVIAAAARPSLTERFCVSRYCHFPRSIATSRPDYQAPTASTSDRLLASSLFASPFSASALSHGVSKENSRPIGKATFVDRWRGSFHRFVNLHRILAMKCTRLPYAFYSNYRRGGRDDCVSCVTFRARKKNAINDSKTIAATVIFFFPPVSVARVTNKVHAVKGYPLHATEGNDREPAGTRCLR